MTRMLSFIAVITGVATTAAGIVAVFLKLPDAGILVTMGTGILVSGEALKKFG